MEMCLRVLKERNKSRIDSYSRQEQCIDHIPYYLPGLSLHVFPHNFSRNSCMHRAQMWTAAALKTESWHAPEYEKPEKRVNWRNISTTEYCWFARDVTAVMLAVYLGISLIWELKPIFM